MKITAIQTRRQSVPLHKPFKTALRTATHVDAILVTVSGETGLVGWGEAPPTLAITGESLASIEAVILGVIKPALIGRNVLDYEQLFSHLHRLVVGNHSAKAAVDMAIYDLIAQVCGLPLYRYLGGYRDRIETDHTVSVNEPQEMGADARRLVQAGFNTLKIKVGKGDIQQDIERIRVIREQVGDEVKLRLDANQGWTPKEAIRGIRRMEEMGLQLELVEQPVGARDLAGLKAVTDAVDTPIMADESCFSPADAFELLHRRCADLLNIKLMKAGGIYRAEQINGIAEACGVECMVGSMLESRLAVSAAAHFAAGKRNVTRCDLDAPLMMRVDPLDGGIRYEGAQILLPEAPGLGIRHVEDGGEWNGE